MKMKKIVSLGLAAVMALSVAACGGGSGDGGNANTPADSQGEQTPAEGEGEQTPAEGEEPSEEGGASTDDKIQSSGVLGAFADPANTEKTDETIVIGMSSEPAYLFCAAAGNVANESAIIDAALRDTLVDFDQQTGEVLPSLATNWEWVDDTHCKFTLRDDVVMTDGTPLVADDVVYTVNELWLKLNATNDTGSYIGEEGAVAEDEHTVTIAFNTASPDLLAMLSWGNFGIVSEDEVNAAGGIEGVQKNPLAGSGKYKFKEWVSGQYVVLERNEDYWDDNYAGYFKEIKLTFTADAAAREMAVESGDAQVAYDMPVSQAATYAGGDKVNVVIHSFGQITHLWFNMGEKAQECTKDPKVRKAIDLALDYDAINQVGTAGYGTTPYGYFEANSKFYNATYTPEERVQDIEQAKALLAEAGYNEGDINLKILGLPDCEPSYTVIQANLKQIGINVELDIPDVPTFVGGAAGGDYDLIQVGDLVSARYPTIFLSLRKHGAYGFSIGGPKWTTDEIDAAIQAAIEEKDEAKAKEMLGDIEKQFKEDTVYVNMYEDLKAAVVAKDIKGYSHIERGFIDITSLYK